MLFIFVGRPSWVIRPAWTFHILINSKLLSQIGWYLPVMMPRGRVLRFSQMKRLCPLVYWMGVLPPSQEYIFHWYRDVSSYRWSDQNFDLCSALKAMCRKFTSCVMAGASVLNVSAEELVLDNFQRYYDLIW